MIHTKNSKAQSLVGYERYQLDIQTHKWKTN